MFAPAEHLRSLHPAATAGGERAALERGRLEQAHGVVVLRRHVLVGAVALRREPSFAPVRDLRDERLDVRGGRRGTSEGHAAATGGHEGAVEDERVEVKVQVERGAEALEDGDAPAARVWPARLLPVPSLHRVEGDPKDTARQLGAAREQPAS